MRKSLSIEEQLKLKGELEPHYEIGDYVKVKEDLISNKTYNDCMFAPQMEIYKGFVYKIVGRFYTIFHKRYFLEGIDWEFSEEMLELEKKKS